jgi:hypothetical protein
MLAAVLDAGASYGSGQAQPIDHDIVTANHLTEVQKLKLENDSPGIEQWLSPPYLFSEVVE